MPAIRILKDNVAIPDVFPAPGIKRSLPLFPWLLKVGLLRFGWHGERFDTLDVGW